MQTPMKSICLAGPLLAFTTAASAEVRLLDQLRRLDVDVELYQPGEDVDRAYILVGSKSESAEARDWGLFDRTLHVDLDVSPDSHGTASQRSTISPGRFEGSGHISVYAAYDRGGSSGSGASRFDVTFEVQEPQRLHLGYELVEAEDFYGDGFDGHVRLTHIDSGASPIVLMEERNFDVSPYPDGVWDRTFATALPPGVYRFEFFMSQDTDLGAGFEYAFDATFAPVPEPGGVALALLAGAPSLLRRRRRGSVGRT